MLNIDLEKDHRQGQDYFDIRIMQMFRYRSMDNSTREFICTNNIKDPAQGIGFFMFDYFDYLRYYRNGQANCELHYQDLIAIPGSATQVPKYAGDPAGMTVNITTLADPRKHNLPKDYSFKNDDDTKVCLKNSYCSSRDPFEVNVQEQNYSSRPFLGLITLNIRSSFFKNNPNINSQMNIDQLLNDLLSDIEEWAKDCLFQNGDEDPPLRAFWTMNTADIILCYRTDKLSLIYQLAYLLYYNFSLPQWPNLKFYSFTSIAMEMIIKDGSYISLTEKSHKTIMEQNKEEIVVLRLNVKSAALQKLKDLAEKLKLKKHNRPYGLFGRYDVTLRISFGDFMKLYPYICMYKFGTINSTYDDLKKELGEDHLLLMIVQGLNSGTIHIANERLSIYFESCSNNISANDDLLCSEEIEEESKQLSTWKSSIKQLYKRVEKLQEEVIELPQGRKPFRESITLFQQILSVFAEIGDQKKSFCDSHYLLYIIQTVLNSIEQYIKYINDLKNELEINCSHIMYDIYIDTISSMQKSMFNAIEHINSFFRIIYARNFRTIHVSNYDIYTAIDSHKYILAYMGFLENYINRNINRFTIYPLLSINRSAVRFSAYPLFPEPSHLYSSKDYDTNRKQLVSISVPSLEYIARIFDMLPLALHEIAHSGRASSKPTREDKEKQMRGDRNDYFVKLVANRFGEYIAKRFITRCTEDLFTVSSEGCQIAVSTSISLAIQDVLPSSYLRKFIIDDLRDAIKVFYLQNVFINIENEDLYHAEKGLCWNLRQILQNIAGYLLLERNNDNIMIMDKSVQVLKLLDEDARICLPYDIWFKIKNYCVDSINNAIIEPFTTPYMFGLLKIFIENIENKNPLPGSCCLCALRDIQNLLLASVGKTETELKKSDWDWLDDLKGLLNKYGWEISKERKIIIFYMSDSWIEGDTVCTCFNRGFVYTLFNQAAHAIVSRLAHWFDDLQDIEQAEPRNMEELFGYIISIPHKNNDQVLMEIKKLEELIRVDIQKVLKMLGYPYFEFDKKCKSVFKDIFDKWNEMLNKIRKHPYYHLPVGERLRWFCHTVAPIMTDEIIGVFRQLKELYFYKESWESLVSQELQRNGNVVGIELFPHWHQDQIVNQVWLRLHHFARQKNASNQYENLILRQGSSFNAIFNSFVVLPEDDNKQFQNIFTGTLNSIGHKVADEIMEEVYEYYSEVNADLFMCHEMKFSYMGYFSFFFKREFQEQLIDNNSIATYKTKDRIMLILSVLMQKSIKCIKYRFNAFNAQDYDYNTYLPTSCTEQCAKCKENNIYQCALNVTPLFDKLIEFIQALPQKTEIDLCNIWNHFYWQMPSLQEECGSIFGDCGTKIVSKCHDMVNALVTDLRQKPSKTVLKNLPLLKNTIKDIIDNLLPSLEHWLSGAMKQRVISVYYDYEYAAYLLNVFLDYMEEGHGVLAEDKDHLNAEFICKVPTYDLRYFAQQYARLSYEPDKNSYNGSEEIDPNLKKVAAYYNEPYLHYIDIGPSEMVHNTISFTLRQYYLHQFSIYKD